MKIGKIQLEQQYQQQLIIYSNVTMKKICIILLIIFCNCENKESKHSEDDIKKVNVYRSKAKLFFPDTIYVGNAYSGYIEYGNEFDKYTTKVNQDGKITRLIDFNYTLDSILYNNDTDLEKKVNYRSPAFNINKIELDSIRIGRKGIFYIQGFVKDLVVFDTIENISYGKPLDGIEMKYFVRKKIVVIE